jgi:pyruvate dehydrogenase E2 component (dihydrolipoamide acetyltransferase)
VRREFRVPDIGEGIAEVEIIEWHVGLGDEIRSDQVVATIQTDKSVVEMPTPLTGTIVFLGGEPGALLAVGSVLVAVETDAETDADAGAGAGAGALIQDSKSSFEDGGSRPTRPSVRAKAAPSVRRLAAEQGVDLNSISGSGPEGRITRDDVLKATNAPVTSTVEGGGRERLSPSHSSGPSSAGNSEDDEHVPLRGLRRQIAKKMIESWRSVPHIIDYREVDASKLIEARHVLREARPEHAGALTYMPLFVKATATALVRHPLMNASFIEGADEYVLHRRIHVGIATATDDGLLVPVVRDADRKSILELAIEISALVELARTRKASLEQLTGGTYTVNNLGALGASMGTPIIRTPEVGITGFGRIGDRVVARDGVAVVRPVLMLSVVGDHRLHDGDTLGAFASTLVRLLENPYDLFELT